MLLRREREVGRDRSMGLHERRFAVVDLVVGVEREHVITASPLDR